MTVSCEMVELDMRALDYVSEHLGSVNVLCATLSKVVATEPGKLRTLAPTGAPHERLYEFTLGGLLASNLDFSRMQRLPDGSGLMPADSLRSEQAKYLRSLLERFPSAACVVDDFNPTWSDEMAQSDPFSFGVGDEIYHLFRAGDPIEPLVQAIGDGDTIWHGVTAICTHAPKLHANRTCSTEQIEAAALSVIALTCTAYDGEGFVVWQRV